MKCSVDECLNESGVLGSARGLCRAHYHRFQRYGDALEPSRRVVSWKGDVCAETGCENKIMAHGLCDNHYQIIKRRNNPEAQKARNQAFKKRRSAKQESEMGRPRPENCELCGAHGKSPLGHRFVGIVFDHDHATGKPRGWLCDRCNKVLGLLKDDVVLLAKMIAYLADPNASSVETERIA